MPFDPPSPSIVLKPSGSIHVRGDIPIYDSDGNLLTPPPSKVPGVVKLCRCAKSQDMPWCDGSHKPVSGER